MRTVNFLIKTGWNINTLIKQAKKHQKRKNNKMASGSTAVPITLVSQTLKDFRGKSEQTDLAIVLGAISQACKTIAAAIRTART